MATDTLVNIGSGNRLSPVRHQAITWTNTDLSSIKPLWTHFNQIVFDMQTFSFTEINWKMFSGKVTAILSRPQRVKDKQINLLAMWRVFPDQTDCLLLSCCCCCCCCFFPFTNRMISWTSIGITAWIIHHIYVKELDAFTNPCPTFHGIWVTPFEVRTRVITSHTNNDVHVITHPCLNSI